jgi:hypothetical protein
VRARGAARFRTIADLRTRGGHAAIIGSASPEILQRVLAVSALRRAAAGRKPPLPLTKSRTLTRAHRRSGLAMRDAPIGTEEPTRPNRAVP